VTQNNPCATMAPLIFLCVPLASAVKQLSNKHSQMFVPPGQLHRFVRTDVCLSTWEISTLNYGFARKFIFGISPQILMLINIGQNNSFFLYTDLHISVMMLVNNMTVTVHQFLHNTNKIHIYEYTLYICKTRQQ